jgi:hypothetical protein
MKLHLREKNGDMNSPDGSTLRKGVQSRSYTSLTLAFNSSRVASVSLARLAPTSQRPQITVENERHGEYDKYWYQPTLGGDDRKEEHD